MEKTCGNCGFFVHEPYGRNFGVCLAGYDREIVAFHSTGASFSCRQCYWCPGWIEAPNTLEQRYQQLAEVARDMITALEVAYIAVDTGREWNSHVIKDYKKRLKELGVEV